MPTQRETPKCPLACHYCRIKKAKCNGVRPCGNCTAHNEVCTFPDVQPRGRKRKEREQELEDRLARMEVLLRKATGSQLQDQDLTENLRGQLASASRPASPTSHQSRQREPTTHSLDSVTSNQNATAAALVDTDAQLSLVEATDEAPSPPPPRLEDLDPVPQDIVFPAPTQHTAPFNFGHGTSDMMLREEYRSSPVATRRNPPPGNLSVMLHNAAAEVGSSALKSDDYDTPGTKTSERYLSICPIPAVEWVSRQFDTSEFAASATSLPTDVFVRGERLDKSLDPIRAPEPDIGTAFRWTDAYFNSCLDAVFRVVDRAAFESRLKAHFKSEQEPALDKAWYALRNVVYAAGCWLTMSETTGCEGFIKARSQSRGYYYNALSVHTDLYLCTDMTSIRALILMAFHAEAQGKPQLEYMLLTSAVRLAQSRGLHLENFDRGNTSQEEISSPQWLWWTLYSYEKHLACRNGRPSAVDDDYISCLMPSISPHSSSEDLEFVLKAAQHAQISSDISKQLNSAKAMRDIPQDTMRNMQNLEERLTSWQQSLNPMYRGRAPFKNIPPQGKLLFRKLFLHFSYHVSIIAIHGAFCYPWDRPDLQNAKSPEIRAQIRRSTEAVGQAARQIILGLQRLENMATLPLWLIFYYPLVGLVNLLVYVIMDPKSLTVAADVSLMDIVVGHFGYLEFVSSSVLVFPFPRTVTSYARHLIEKANKSKPHAMISTQMVETAAVPCSGDNIPTDATERANWALSMPLPTEVANMDSQTLGWEELFPFLPSITEGTSFAVNGNTTRGDDMGFMAHNI